MTAVCSGLLPCLVLAALPASVMAQSAPAQRQAPTQEVPPPSQAPFGFVTAGKLADQCTDGSAYAVSFCFAYLAGIHDATRSYQVWLGQREFCAPRGITLNRLRDVFVTFVRANRSYRSAQGASVAVVAFRNAFPCA